MPRRLDQPEADLTLDGCGSIYTMTANWESALEWGEANVDIPEYMWLGDSIFAVEWRFVAHIITGAQADGLSVE